jgi:tRNA G18 (ribose-2'-O)-methylase SpoU
VRIETRRQRYNKKKNDSTKFPVEVACINFKHEPNIGYVIRAAACFGASRVNLIGSTPESKVLKELSGTTSDFIDICSYSNPHDFLEYTRNHNIQIISAEITEGAKNIHEYSFPKDKKVCIVVGNEQTGIPPEILKYSEIVQIPMPGLGYCLNTSQTANIMLYEYTKQFTTSNLI